MAEAVKSTMHLRRCCSTSNSYGEEITSTNNDTYKFAQTYRDSDTGLDYAKARFYASGVGRFLTVDPYAPSGRQTNPQSWNRYAYVSGDPVNRIDPSGAIEVIVCSDPEADSIYDGSCDLEDGGSGFAGGGGGAPGPNTRAQQLQALRTLVDAAAAAQLAANIARNPSNNAQIPAGLVMSSECWTQGSNGGTLAYTLEVTYQIVSSSGSAMSGASLAGISVSENLQNISSSDAAAVKDSQSTWTYGTSGGIQQNGTFTDYLTAGGIGGLGAAPWQAFQSFTATGFLSNGIPLIPQPLTVSGFGPTTTVLSDNVGTNNATINGFGLGTNPATRCKN